MAEIKDDHAARELQNLHHLGDVQLEVKVELGRKKMSLSAVRQLHQGDILVLDVLGENFGLALNNVAFALGEVVINFERKSLRLTRFQQQETGA